MNNWITNISLSDVENGNHLNPTENSMLIQIVDPVMDFPIPKFKFKEIHQFKFLDLEETDNYEHSPGQKITQQQADDLVKCLLKAADNHMNVIVHCVVGICRSGAVTEVGTILGFDDLKQYRQPNLMVKKFMLRTLGLTYESDE